jgi:EAL domain-containing protein (putative c-di-GMP-specific phosphodiesterase class I)
MWESEEPDFHPRGIIEDLLEYVVRHAESQAEPKDGACWTRIGRAREYLGVTPTPMDSESVSREKGGDEWADLGLDLHEAIRGQNFALHFQPISDVRSLGVVGVEALIRWNHPGRGQVPPAVFLTVAERSGLIHQMGRWVLKAACAQLARWDESGLSLPYVAVNVSPVQIRQPQFLQYVDEALEWSGLSADRLVLEITEGLVIHQQAEAGALFEALNDRGVGIAIDDFGTGYSSLAYLHTLPVSKLKLDRSFVANLPASRHAAAIVQAVVSLARTLDLELVAEGVETEAQRELLNGMECRYIQGWLVCKALPAEELVRAFAARTLRMEYSFQHSPALALR